MRKIIKVKTKSEFIEHCSEFKNPVISFGFDERDLLSQFWVVKDNYDFDKNTIELPGCRLSVSEYLRGYLESYNARREQKHKRYIKWMTELFGDFFSINQL